MSLQPSFSVRMPVLAFMLAIAWQGANAQQAIQAGQDRIESLRLSSGGVAEVHRRISVDDASSVRLNVPVAQLDDLLKSLVVRDPNGSVTGIVLDGLAPLEETFEHLPFGPADLQSPASLAARLPGAAVRATSGGRTVEGTILGVTEAADASVGEGGRPAPLLSVLAADGSVQTLRLGNDSVMEILDEELRNQLQAALAVSREHRNESVRSVKISLDGKGKRDIDLSYVVAAPVWKSTYRLVTDASGKARLQAWAVLENASGQDWKDVSVTLTSGAPVMLSQRLLQRYWNDRPEVPVAVGAAEAPRVDMFAQMEPRDRADVQMEMEARSSAKRMAMAPAPAPAMAASAYGGGAGSAGVPEAAAQEGQTSVSYTLPAPVSVAAGQTLSVPFLDASLKAEQVSVFQADRGKVHPVAGVWLENSTEGSLPPGILTVYDQQAGHIGDAQLAGLPAGESRLVYFAEDRKVEVRADTRPQEQVSEVKVSQGVLHITRQLRRETTYTIKGASDADRTVLIEQPRQQGWELKSESLAGSTAAHYRLRAQVPAAGQAQVKAVLQRTDEQTMRLLDADADRLLYWSGIASDSKAAERLKTLADLRRELAQAQQREAELAGEHERIVANQSRIRENLSSVPADSSLGQRYLGLLAQEEDRIAAVAQEVEQARKQTAERRKAMETALAQ